jgi:hypothetical protein
MMHSISAILIKLFTKPFIKAGAKLICISLLFITQTAHADFRKALDAYMARDGATMLKEVKDAVDKKNGDGIILFLGILKQYPKTWRPMLNEAQQTELFNCVEKAAAQSSLQAQYKLAVIPRKENNPPPIPAGTNKDRESWYEARKQEKLKEYQDEIAKLYPVANKGYAPAALHLYFNYAHHLTKSKADQDNAMKWLKKAAEFGNPIAAYLLGMKYLNIRDNQYGCRTNSHDNLCLPKDEAKGWYWVQQAAKYANEPSVMLLDDLALNLGDLYMQGVAGNKPDYEQAYLWYQRMPSGFTSDTSPVWPKLEKLRKLGQLERLNPALDKAWGNATTWQEAVKSEEVIKSWQKSPNKLPKLMQQSSSKNNKASPVFSMSTVRWYKPNASYAGIVLDVYDDGRVNLLIGDAEFNESNDELWMRIQPHQVKAFVDEVQNLKLENMPWIWPSCVGCVENRTDFVTLNYSGVAKTVEIVSATFANKEISNPEVSGLLKAIEKYYPLSKLICDVDVGDGKSICYEMYKQMLNHAKKGEK